MFSKNGTDTRSWIRSWPVIITVVVAILAGLNVLRVNQPKRDALSAPDASYSTEGPLVVGRLTIPPNDFYSRRIELNRPTRLNGSFRTPNVRMNVSVVVLTEREFERWRAGSDFAFIVQTGFVPGGKVNPVLEPGSYFLIVDNRPGASTQAVDVEFILE